MTGAFSIARDLKVSGVGFIASFPYCFFGKSLEIHQFRDWWFKRKMQQESRIFFSMLFLYGAAFGITFILSPLRSISYPTIQIGSEASSMEFDIFIYVEYADDV